MVIVIELKFDKAQSLHLRLIFEVKDFILCVIEVFQCYNIKHVTAISRVKATYSTAQVVFQNPPRTRGVDFLAHRGSL